jgi:hypothetical protein
VLKRLAQLPLYILGSVAALGLVIALIFGILNVAGPVMDWFSAEFGDAGSVIFAIVVAGLLGGTFSWWLLPFESTENDDE